MTASRAALVAVLCGFATMCLELTAVRLLAPHFGDSAYVWTNVIGVILVALALGAILGGRFADRGASARALGYVLFVAAGCTAVAPFAAGPLAAWLLPRDLPLEAAMPALVRGSLLATLVVFAPPVLLLGAGSPWLTALLAKAGSVGRASALVSAAGTLGSLLGTFAATHFLVPQYGSRPTVFLCAALLGVAAVVCARRGRPIPVACALLMLVPLPPLRAAGPGEKLLAERESRYQYLQATERHDGGVRTVVLLINEGLDSFHSMARADGPFTMGAYYDYHVVTPWLAQAGLGRSGPGRVLSLGAAAGTFDRLFAAVHPGVQVDEVEIDPAVVALGDAFFGGKRAAGARYPDLDARVFTNRATGPYEVVLVDAYARQIYVPAHVVSREFFAAASGLLQPGGVVAVNLGGCSFSDRVVRCVAATIADVFGSCAAFRVPDSRNFMLLGRKGQRVDRSVLAGVAAAAGSDLQRVLRELARPGAWREFGPGSETVLRDGWPLLDALQEQALGAAGAQAEVMPIGGDAEVASSEAKARQELLDADYEGVLATVRSSRTASAYLRFLAGDARWRLHDPAGAVCEYEAARALDPRVVEAQVLEQRLAGARQLAAKDAQARAVAARNAWLAWAVGLLGVAAVALLWRR